MLKRRSFFDTINLFSFNKTQVILEMLSSEDFGSSGKKETSPDSISIRSFSAGNNFQSSSSEKTYSKQKSGVTNLYIDLRIHSKEPRVALQELSK